MVKQIARFGGVLLVMVTGATGYGQTQINVNVASGRHSISPQIYGTAWATATQLADLNFTINRYGGNNSSRYNWKLNADNRGSDWYFQSIGDDSSVAGERIDSFLGSARSANAEPMVTIPLLPYVAKLGSGRSKLWSFSQQKYGSQTDADWNWAPDAGNGISTKSGNPYITGNDPLDANTPNSVTLQQGLFDHLKTTWGTAAQGGLRYYIMDNEPSIWHATHRDVHPDGQSYDELYNLYKQFGGAIRSTDSGAKIVGPEEWGWSGYLFSGRDLQWHSQNGWGQPGPDQASHNNLDHLTWFLQTMRKHQQDTGVRLLDVFSLHYYPQEGEFSDDNSAAMQAIRNRSTRSLWDPSYTDTSWIGSVVKLIPRMKSYVQDNYPGLQTAITEYNWGNESHMNGATAQADIMGIFGKEGLDMSARWGTPPTNSPVYLAMKIYRNYDGNKSAFGDTSVDAVTPDRDRLAAYAAERSGDGAVTVMVINKEGASTSLAVNLSGFTPGSSAAVYQISSDSQTSITHRSNVAIASGKIVDTVPARSVTLYVVPRALPSGFEFETSTDGWTSSGAQIGRLERSRANHYLGASSLLAVIQARPGTGEIGVNKPGVTAGKTVKMRLWVPAHCGLSSVRPYVRDANGTMSGAVLSLGQIRTGGWSTLSVTVPSTAKLPVARIGVQFTLKKAWYGPVYLDSVEW